MISDLIVWSSVVLTAVFSVAWLVRRDLRARMERPKHRFQADVGEYDRARMREDRGHGTGV
jgi:hypothetical protein